MSLRNLCLNRLLRWAVNSTFGCKVGVQVGSRNYIAEVSCACTRVRSCKICESSPRVQNIQLPTRGPYWVSVFCLNCSSNLRCEHYPSNCGNELLKGVSVYEDFISSAEEKELVSEIDKLPWSASQSGRCKQDFGPRANYKKQKLNLNGFVGLPRFSQYLRERVLTLENMKDFIAVEQCNLDYKPEVGSSIDPHRDDCWLWGERIVIINLLSDTIMNFTSETSLVNVPLPQRSVLIMSGDARCKWMHSIDRDSIKVRRISVTFRELSDVFRKHDRKYDGFKILEAAKKLI